MVLLQSLYDDRVAIFDEKGAQIGGKNTFAWDTRPVIFDVVDGHTANMVTLDSAGNWVSKETGLIVNYDPITGIEAGMHSAINPNIDLSNMSTPQQSVKYVLSQADMDVIANIRSMDDDMKNVVAATLNEFGVRMAKGQIPSREMMQQVTAELSAKYGVKQFDLTKNVELAMSKEKY